ncbi:hypothetical protein [Paenibacillus sp. PastF-1]|uniref:hypothetical protein n=1 Tax=unclassified Paenibacillus TaxID=185978 RepID=UPI00247BC7B3|nr:hypothetical protein [Paenibacillus sp. PastF-2]MDF9851648.1 hypothetical protein [Paenibacillus sp. PastM-2]MDF9858232.1 hypothetical protein [Paenibacillus sp. PastF-1]MDH6483488.1 hypothetical protein [Paenibacillus sp. PastH-2]MDH6510900.1 hypothetical protein [Paenibacillus sp. PastM-3]
MSGVLSGSPKDEPLHYGEIYDLWQFFASAKMALSAFQTCCCRPGCMQPGRGYVNP